MTGESILHGSLIFRVLNPQPLHRLAADDMGFHNLRHVLRLHAAIPDSFGIDHNGGAELAGIEAAGLVRSDDAA